MRYFLLPLLLFALLAFRPATPDLQPATVHEDAVAVVELFTSQGCSSCPPADQVLARLRGQAEREGLNIIPLSYHVDYWNSLGWADPFSDPAFTARQHDYTDRLKVRTYTPQLVVNGRREMIGSRQKEVFATVQQSLQIPMAARIGFTTAHSGRNLTVNFTAAGADAGAKIILIAARREAAAAVKRGENRGRDLEHVNVVRALKAVDYAAEGSVILPLPDDLDPADALVVALIQRGAGGPLLAASSSDFSD